MISITWKYGRRAGGSRGCVVLPWNIFGTCSWKTSKLTLELRSKQALFWKWLSRPNQYAHKICIEILCRTPVSILKYLSPRPQNHMKNFKYSSLGRMSILPHSGSPGLTVRTSVRTLGTVRLRFGWLVRSAMWMFVLALSSQHSFFRGSLPRFFV